MLEQQRAELGAVRRPELEHAHEWTRPCSADAASTSGSSIARDALVGAPGDRRRRVERHEHAVGEHADPRGQRQRLAHVVRDDDDGLADRGLDAPKLAVQLAARDGIERAERLVHQQNRRIGGERARDPDALALAAGQLLRPPRRELVRPADRRGRAARRRARRSAPRPSRAAAARRRCCRARSGAERGRPPGGRSRCGGGDRRDPTSPTGRPRTTTSPASGTSSRLISLRMVLLPAPLRPTSASVSPCSTSRSRPWSTDVPPRLSLTPRKAISVTAAP